MKQPLQNRLPKSLLSQKPSIYHCMPSTNPRFMSSFRNTGRPHIITFKSRIRTFNTNVRRACPMWNHIYTIWIGTNLLAAFFGTTLCTSNDFKSPLRWLIISIFCLGPGHFRRKEKEWPTWQSGATLARPCCACCSWAKILPETSM